MTSSLPTTGSPTVSVIVAAYNRAAWIPVTVESVLRQTHAPLEVIVVDDGSTDDTREVCAALPAPVRYLHKPNGGVSSARNFGVRHATGDYVAFVDADDVWDPRKLEWQLAALAAVPSAEWSITDCDVIALDGTPLPARSGFVGVFPLFRETGDGPNTLFSRWLRRLHVRIGAEHSAVYAGDAHAPLFLGNFVLPSSSLVRRERFLAAGGFDESFRLAEETEFFHRLASQAPVAIVMRRLVGYRVGQTGGLTSPANTSALVRNALTSIDRSAQLRDPLDPRAHAAYDRGRQRLLLALAWSRLVVHDRAGAREASIAAWRAGSRSPRLIALWAAAEMLPASVLGLLHQAKRVLSGRAGPLQWWRA